MAVNSFGRSVFWVCGASNACLATCQAGGLDNEGSQGIKVSILFDLESSPLTNDEPLGEK